MRAKLRQAPISQGLVDPESLTESVRFRKTHSNPASKKRLPSLLHARFKQRIIGISVKVAKYMSAPATEAIRFALIELVPTYIDNKGSLRIDCNTLEKKILTTKKGSFFFSFLVSHHLQLNVEM
jgi:hypothetical protein